MIWLFLLAGCIEYDLRGDGSVPPPGDQPSHLWPNTVEDTFEQRPALASDILFVVDDSFSMAGEQANLVDNFDAFGQFLFGSDVDFHIGVVRGDLSTSSPDYPDYGRLTAPYIDPSTPDGEAVFNGVIAGLGEDGDGICESSLEAIHLALTQPLISTENAGFYRDDAMLTAVIVTDENDQTAFSFCDLTLGTPAAWAQWFTDLKSRPGLVNLGVIAGFDRIDNETPTYCSSNLGSADAATWYSDAAAGVPNSRTWSICNADWQPVLEDLGLAAAGLTRSFTLTRVPAWDDDDFDGDGITDEPALEVWLDRQDGEGPVQVQPVWDAQPDPDNPWDYDRVTNAVVFTVETMPDEHWLLTAIYPNSEEG